MSNLTVLKPLESQFNNLPREVIFCTKCVISNQRPRIVFDEEGVCSACRYAEAKRRDINWKAREIELEKLLDKYRRNDGRWDVVVPSSGGKDSSYVAHHLKHRYGMHPLTVTWAPFAYTAIGFQNLTSKIASGFNNILVHPNGKLHRKLARLSFEEVGDNFLPFIYGHDAVPINMALKFDIKLLFKGEIGEAEYGGDPTTAYSSCFPFNKYDALFLKGTSVDKLIEYGLNNKDYMSKEDYDPSDLIFYRMPPLEEIMSAGIAMHYYSYYHSWTPQENYYYASENTGFKANPERSEGTYSKYASLDDKMDGLHYYLGFIKFGIGRTTSDAAHEIRDGHINREEGIALVKRFDGEFPSKYFKDTLEYLDVTEEHFWEVIDSFRLPHIWAKVDGKWKLRHTVSRDGIDD